MNTSFNTGNKGYTDVAINDGNFIDFLNAIGAVLYSRGISDGENTTLYIHYPNKHRFRFEYKDVDPSDNKTVYVFQNTEAEDYLTSDNGIIRHTKLKIKDTGSTYECYGMVGFGKNYSSLLISYVDSYMFKDTGAYEDTVAPLKATIYW